MTTVIRRLVITVIVGAALFAIVFALSRGQTGELAQVSREGVVRVLPPPGAQELRQLEIGIDLEPGWTGVLQIDGVEIPEDQLRRVPELFQVWFRPGPGRIFEELAPGRRCVTALIWRIEETRDEARPVEWCFDVTA